MKKNEYIYSFDEVTLLANKNVNFINNILKLERIGLIKTIIDAVSNNKVLTIFNINDVLISESKKILKNDFNDIFTKENLNEILSIMNFDNIIHSENIMVF